MKKISDYLEETETDGGRIKLRKLVKGNTGDFQEVYDKGDRYVVEIDGETEAVSFKNKPGAMKYIKAEQKSWTAKQSASSVSTASSDTSSEEEESPKKGTPKPKEKGGETSDPEAESLKGLLESVNPDA